MNKTARFAQKLLLVTFFAGLLGGCAFFSDQKIEPIWSNGNAALAPDQIIEVMRQAHFSDKEIIRLGPKLRNALALEGGARVKTDKMTEALFMVNETTISGTSVKSGLFQYELNPPVDGVASKQ